MSLNWAINHSVAGKDMYLATAGIPPISASVVPMPTIAEEVCRLIQIYFLLKATRILKLFY